uniref:Uncharacterized protein n=1 Tax=Lepeophtheirus salmonis TaxID=72036 RepID=A0A0K2SY14_LEPSM
MTSFNQHTKELYIIYIHETQHKQTWTNIYTDYFNHKTLNIYIYTDQHLHNYNTNTSTSMQIFQINNSYKV